MVKKISEIRNVIKEGFTNKDETGKDILLFNLMSGTCSRNCPNCYDKDIKKENMKPEIFDYYLKLIRSVSEDKVNNVSSTQLNTIASRVIEYPYLQQYLNSVIKYNFTTAVYAADLGTTELFHPAINLIFFHPTDHVEDEIDTFKKLELDGKRIDIRFNFTQGKAFKEQTEPLHKLMELVGNDEYLLRYSVTAKTKDPNSKHFTLETFPQYKDDFFDMLYDLSKNYPNMKFRAERPFFKCNFTEKEIKEYQETFGLTFYCAMEFTISPGGLCGLCPPIATKTNAYYKEIPKNSEEFIVALNTVRQLDKELSTQPSFERCAACEEKCQGGCLSYKIYRNLAF